MKRCLTRAKTIYAGALCWTLLGAHDALAAEGGMGAIPSAEEAHGGGLPQLDSSTFPSQLFWLAVTFVVLYLIFSKKSLPEISGVLENRQNHIQSDLEMAERLKNEANKAQETYEKSLQNARNDASKALHDAQDKIKAKAGKQAEAFRAKAEKDVNELERQIDAAKQSAMEDMTAVAAEIASEAARKIVGINTDPEQAKTVVKALNGGANAKAA